MSEVLDKFRASLKLAKDAVSAATEGKTRMSNTLNEIGKDPLVWWRSGLNDKLHAVEDAFSSLLAAYGGSIKPGEAKETWQAARKALFDYADTYPVAKPIQGELVKRLLAQADRIDATQRRELGGTVTGGIAALLREAAAALNVRTGAWEDAIEAAAKVVETADSRYGHLIAKDRAAAKIRSLSPPK